MKALIEKYNTPVPRYTSYPTVPNWKPETFTKENYLDRLEQGFTQANADGISVYVHLPFCESLCTYCGCNTRITINHKVEVPYAQAVIKEWDLMKSHFTEKPRVREIHLGGGTPTFFSPANLKMLVEGLLENVDIPKDASFSFEAHPSNTTQEHLDVLRGLGFDRLSLGIQDFDPKVQKAINRWQSVEDVDRVMKGAKQAGYRSVNFDLVYGLPFQTMEGVRDAVEKVIELGPDRIAFYSYAHVPWIHPGQRAYSEADLPSPELKLALFTMGRQLLLDAGYVAIGFDHFALKTDSLYKSYADGTMHRNFMGFSDLRTDYLIGLGVSSISDIHNGFAQNIKAVEPYIEKVNNGIIPLFKGHLHSERDTYIRDKILELTCKHVASWKGDSLENREYMNGCLPRLEEQVNDGLVIIGDEEVRVTEKGRVFVRHICAAFDADMHGVETKQRFAQGV